MKAVAGETDAPAATDRGRIRRVEVEGVAEFDAPPAAVWRVLIHPDSLAKTMPGVDRVEVRDEDHWTAHVTMRLGLFKLRLPLECTIEHRREPESARLVAAGSSAAGGIRMATTFDLAEAPAGTEMRWRAEVELSGRASAVSDKMLRPLVDRQVRKLLESLRNQVRAEAA